eukprot:1314703-Amorphochlora_amoeboformis.AAC.1
MSAEDDKGASWEVEKDRDRRTPPNSIDILYLKPRHLCVVDKPADVFIEGTHILSLFQQHCTESKVFRKSGKKTSEFRLGRKGGLVEIHIRGRSEDVTAIKLTKIYTHV